MSITDIFKRDTVENHFLDGRYDNATEYTVFFLNRAETYTNEDELMVNWGLEEAIVYRMSGAKVGIKIL